MDINLLVVNVGNSRLSIGAFVAGELDHVVRVPNTDREAWRAALSEGWKKIEGRENRGVCGATVNPPVSEPLEHAIEQITGTRVQWVGREIDLPTKVLTEAPQET